MGAELANTIWSATSLAQDETTVKAAALSVRQRKLLAFLSTPMSVDSLSTMSGLPHPEVESTLARFAKLGLAASQGGEVAAAPGAFRASSFETAAASGSKLPLILGGVALTAVAAAIWWFTRSTPATPPAPQNTVATNTASQPGKAATASAPSTSPSEASTTSVFVPASPTAAPTTPTPADAAKLAAAAKEREAAAREAAKNTKQVTPPTAAAQPTAPATTSAPPAPTTAAAAPAPTPAPAPAPAPAAVTAQPATASAPPPPSPALAAAPAPAAQVAAAPAQPPAPRPAAPAASREGALLSRVEPQFPRNADVDRGSVRARLTVNASGAVTNVEIVESNPPRVFDRNVRTALAQWRYEGTGEPQTKLVEVQFNR